MKESDLDGHMKGLLPRASKSLHSSLDSVRLDPTRHRLLQSGLRYRVAGYHCPTLLSKFALLACRPN